MKKKVFMAAVNGVLFFIFSTVTHSYSAEFKKGGYDIEVFWKQKRDTLKVWGEVDGGKKCSQLNLSIYFKNSKESGSGHVEAAITEYDGSFRNSRYEATDTVYVNSVFRNNWHVDNIFVTCLK